MATSSVLCCALLCSKQVRRKSESPSAAGTVTPFLCFRSAFRVVSWIVCFPHVGNDPRNQTKANELQTQRRVHRYPVLLSSDPRKYARIRGWVSLNVRSLRS